MRFKTYLASLNAELKHGNATEHTHRPALKALIESLAPDLLATNEPKRIECGAPDYIVTRGGTPIGYIEAKDVNIPLDRVEDDEQLRRYRGTLRSLILTDYLEFRLYRDGEHVQTARLAKWQKNGVLKSSAEGIERVNTLLTWFFQSEVPTVANPRELAERMAHLARMIRDLIVQAFLQEAEQGELHGQLQAFRKVLLGEELTTAEFADMYAQTICYGLFAARCNHVRGGFNREDAAKELPKTNPFLRKLFQHIAGHDLDERVAWAVDDLAYLLARADMAAILEDFGKATRGEDPIVHFYETFLAAYDPKLRETRGVYYTPEPVVSYIVRSVDAILKRDFKLAMGVADNSKVKLKRPKKQGKGEETFEIHRMQILDPAAGTGTFLYALINRIRESFAGNAGMWRSYVAEHLLPRLYGFELLMAPYAVAHMKLGLLLKETGYDFEAEGRLRVYLTNTLEETHELTGLPLFTQWLAKEAASASSVKQDVPIMVVLGNPPYSGHSANRGEWIHNLLRGNDSVTGQEAGNYFEVDGAPLGERNPKWLNDDYVKFLRFAQWRIEQTGYGVLAFITNHGYLDNPTFRGMRQSLLQTFDDLYVLDLHGNSKKKEKAPDGSKDENVFDIQQGVAIGMFVKRASNRRKPAFLGEARHAEIYGLRESKYQWLWEHDVGTTKWKTLNPKSPRYLLGPQDEKLSKEYEAGWKVTEAFPVNVLGFQTHRDQFAIDFEQNRLLTRITEMRNKTISDTEFAEKYDLESANSWTVAKARETLRGDAVWLTRLVQCAYRPFDNRWCYFSEAAMDRPRRELKEHVAGRENYCFNLLRQTRSETWQHALVSNLPTPAVFVEIKDGSSVFPLYLYSAEQQDLFNSTAASKRNGRIPNITPEFVRSFTVKLKLKFVEDGSGDLKTTFGPEDIFHYAYAVFYCPTYRTRYAQFLKGDFPRLPLTSNVKVFTVLCALGKRLVALHLMEEQAVSICKYPVAGNNRVDKVAYEAENSGRVYINVEQYFGGVPQAVWNYHIGGYQVANKWLKDRKGRLLTFDDLQHYQRVIAVLAETIKLQAEIDAAIPTWPIE